MEIGNRIAEMMLMDKFDLEKWRLSDERVKTRLSESTQRRLQARAKKREGVFVKLPYEETMRVAATGRNALLATIVELAHVSFKSKNKNPVKLTNGYLKRFGLSRKGKGEALQRLESAGLILVNRVTGKSPIVTLNWIEPRAT